MSREWKLSGFEKQKQKQDEVLFGVDGSFCCCFSGWICQGFGIEFNDKTRVAFDWIDYGMEDCGTFNLFSSVLC